MDTIIGKDASILPPATGSSHINLRTPERMVSVLGGLALSILGVEKIRSPLGIASLMGGVFLLTRGMSGYCALTQRINSSRFERTASGMEATSTFIVNAPRADVYAYWRAIDNLLFFMSHLKEVIELDDKRSKWISKIPGNMGTVSWEAEIVNDISGQLISWRSLPGSMIDNAGFVSFEDAPTGGTEITARISYRLPAGDVGAIAAKLFNPAIEQMMNRDLRSFKRLIEGEQQGIKPTDENTGNDKRAYFVTGVD